MSCFFSNRVVARHRVAAMITTMLLGLNVAIADAEDRRPERDANQHWSFQPIVRPELPATRFGVRNAIDCFVRQRLVKEGLFPSSDCNRAKLIRRVTLDLTGMPPTLPDVDAFVSDERPDAYERLVDRLLASPQYGERWARPWLDLCHYADTDGYLTDQLRPVAWRYRDWLINALNSNQPFDRFTIEQLAGDLLPNATIEQRMATGFLRQTLSNREGGAEPEEFRVRQVVDRTKMVGTIWLGLTIGCCQCHDHKYDPLPQDDFFAMYACLNNADEVNIDAPLEHEVAAWWDSRAEYRERREALISPVRKGLEELQRGWEAKGLHAMRHPGEDHIWDRQWELLGLVWGGGLGEGQLEGQEICKLPWDKRTWRQKADLLDFLHRRLEMIDQKKYNELRLHEVRDKLDKLKAEFPKATRAPVMRAAVNPRNTHLHERGDFRSPAENVEPGTPGCLPVWRPKSDEPPRLAMARWLVSKENPLTARVVVNRMWQEFFGRGIVLTSEDFGTRGERPSHPELLDWLASEFIDSAWDVKRMHRLIVTSSTYRQSSKIRPDKDQRDPDNVLLARQRSLRLPAETIRDSMLSVSALLYPKLGGPSVKPDQPQRVTQEAFGQNKWEKSEPPECYRRGLYTFTIRTAPFAQSAIFDAPNPNEICTRRVRSNTSLQSLVMLNDPVFVEMARGMARRVLSTDIRADRERLDYLARLCLSRRLTVEEQDHLKPVLAKLRKRFDAAPKLAAAHIGDEFGDRFVPAEAAVWSNMCTVFLNTHEFITRD